MTTDTAPRRADVRQRTTLGNRFRFLVRVLGLTGLLAVPVGWRPGRRLPAAGPRRGPRRRPSAPRSRATPASSPCRSARSPLVAGAAAVLLWLRRRTARRAVPGRRPQDRRRHQHRRRRSALAAALLVIVNVVSFGHHWRFDLTRDQQFTFPQGLVDELRTLRADSPTTIVVLHLHATAGSLSDEPDALRPTQGGRAEGDREGQRPGRPAPRVRPAVQRGGPRRRGRPVRAAGPGADRAPARGWPRRSRTAPENSIFFYADEKVRRLPRAEADRLADGLSKPRHRPGPRRRGAGAGLRRGDHPDELRRLLPARQDQLQGADDTGARGGRGGRRRGRVRPRRPRPGNLVLLPRGKEAFVRKVLALEERKPRVALAVIHPLLDQPRGVRRVHRRRAALDPGGERVRGGGRDPQEGVGPRRGADPGRVHLRGERTRPRRGPVQPAQPAGRRPRGGHRPAPPSCKAKLDKATLAELDRTFGRQLGRRITDRGGPRASSAGSFDDNVAAPAGGAGRVHHAGRPRPAPQYRDLLRNERAAENRRVTDVKAKLKQYVADCDLLIVPRLTVVDIARGDVIPPSLFNLSKDQAEVVKEFVKAGKPVLFAVGPTNVDRRGPPGEPAGDDVERLLPQLGIEPRQPDDPDRGRGPGDGRAAERGAGRASVDVPPLVFDVPRKDGKAPNPVAEAFRVTARAVDRKLDLKRSGFRPVYVAPARPAGCRSRPRSCTPARRAGTRSQPVPDDDAVPKFDPAKPDDPKKGTPRRGTARAVPGRRGGRDAGAGRLVRPDRAADRGAADRGGRGGRRDVPEHPGRAGGPVPGGGAGAALRRRAVRRGPDARRREGEAADGADRGRSATAGCSPASNSTRRSRRCCCTR